ncbi:hypothetical protein ACFL6I_05830 [candidate division KSB1 bacterium]
MSHSPAYTVIAAVVFLFCVTVFSPFTGSSVLYGQTAVIKGSVRNGTTGGLHTAEAVRLFDMGTGEMMQVRELNNVSEFVFDGLIRSAMAHYLVQVEYKGVIYSENVPLQTGIETVDTDVTVYEPTSDDGVIHIENVQIVFANTGPRLQVVRVYRIANNADVSKTYVSDNGTFKFAVDPMSAGIDFVTTNTGATPVNQAPFETDDHGIFAIDYPFKPGVTEVTVSYSVDYSSGTYTFSESQLYDIPEVFVACIPADMAVSGMPLEHAGLDSQRDMHVYSAEPVTAGSTVSFTLSGGSPGGQIMWTPNRVDEYKYVLIPLVLALLLLGNFVSRNKAAVKSKSTPKKLLQQKDALLNEIAQLDDKFAQNQMSESDYKRKRGQLKNRLIELYKRIDKAA